MYDLFLPYEISFEDGSETYCCEGEDRRGERFGVGSGPTVAIAERHLREAVFESLLADASDGNDYTSDLCRSPKGDHCLRFTTLDLMPIRVRLARAMRRLKQVEVAERMGISQQAYARLERAGANPTLGLLVRLEEALQQELLLLA